MGDRGLAELIDLVERVEQHCEARVWNDPAQEAQRDQDHADWKAGRLGRDDQNIYDVSRAWRWASSWTRRREKVAAALVAAMPGSVVDRIRATLDPGGAW